MCVSHWCAIVSNVTRERVGPLVFEAAIFSVRYLAAREWTLVALKRVLRRQRGGDCRKGHQMASLCHE